MELMGWFQSPHLTGGVSNHGDPYLMTGRVIRRLVSLTDRVKDLVGEYNRRTSLYDSNDNPQYTEEEGCTYQSFQQLLRWIPTIHGLISSQTNGHQLNLAYQKVSHVMCQLIWADSARGDDMASMKLAVASWLNKSSPPPNPPIHSCDKTGRGFYNDATAKLLCPVDLNWADPVDGEYDREDPTKGLFKGSFLIRTFKHIFMSPSSAADARPDEELPVEPFPKQSRTQGERRTRSDLRFALSSCGSWRNIDDDFEHDQFYVYIVDYFENPPTPTAKASVDALLVKVFGPRSVSTYSPQVAAHYSVANTSAKRH
ncbi:uncharacterized protein F5891DRAFT_1131472 [Suillus fuscotomentosus]|uniref:Uncharacterized protein n=1 Tax=Suillus fuscotomentosus TaxID=1912939 RepID=A0AAD4DTU8_9AGAM|nr:uncharacterized protein F5891DRAFT_1131472 [Suillus fuscotomentosus]KAG1891843.1 hypothetical protein F5891DRAFT_1131472 [Suillus fuscotomentosus]